MVAEPLLARQHGIEALGVKVEIVDRVPAARSVSTTARWSAALNEVSTGWAWTTRMRTSERLRTAGRAGTRHFRVDHGVIHFHGLVEGANPMILSVRDKRVADILAGRAPGKGFPPDLLRAVRRKLIMLADATTIEDCRSPPGNRLEALSGDRAGQWSIRVNDQFRICFRWDEGAHDVEIVDYHR